MNAILAITKHAIKELIRKKDFYVLLFLFCGLMAFFYNESFMGVTDISRYIKDVGYSLITLFTIIITVTYSARQIPSELESKTIYPLLAKPVSRAQFILGKYAGAAVVSFLSFSSLFVLYIFMVYSKGEGAPAYLVLQSYILSILLFLFLSAITMALSLFLTIAANVTIVLLVYFLTIWGVNILSNSISQSKGLAAIIYNFIYYIIPHFEFYDIKIRLVHLWDALPLRILLSVIVYTFVYISVVLLIFIKAFNKKSL